MWMVLVAALTSVAPRDQGRDVVSDLVGAWTIVNAADAPDEAAREVRVVQVPHAPPTIAVSAKGGTIPRSGRYQVGIIGGVVGGDGARRHSSAVVKDHSLVLETSNTPSAGQSDEPIWYLETWTVAGDRLTIHVQERRNDRRTIDATLVYRRQ